VVPEIATRLELDELPYLFRQVLVESTDKRDTDVAHRSTPQTRQKIPVQGKRYKRFLYASSQDKEQVQEHIRLDGDVIDDKVDIFLILSRTVLARNVPCAVDRGKPRESLARVLEIVWLQAEDAICRGRERLDVFVVTSFPQAVSRRSWT
jgi:hypothetical protein